jgi:hypothetical protein
MSEPDWAALAAIEQAVVDDLSAVMNIGLSMTGQHTPEYAAYSNARMRRAVFEARAKARSDAALSPTPEREEG